jgi:glycosyltransferase involved in cell wall biosynthesis
MNDQLPLVSIICPTYNHEKFIERALEGFVMQKTEFPFEIIVHDDASLDNTVSIVKEYERQFPQLFSNIYQSVNQLSKEISSVTRITMAAAKGKYIALCEGDDYWIDPFKLQKQVDFLENNPDFAICFHNAKIISEANPEIVSYSNQQDQPSVTTFEDLAKGEFIYTPTCMFRAKYFRMLPTEYYKYINNYTVDLHIAQFGNIKYFADVMSVYRIHSGGMWSMVAREKTLINQLPCYKFYIGYFDKKFSHYFIKHVQNMTKELMDIKFHSKSYANFWIHYLDFVKYNVRSWQNFKYAIYMLLKVNFDKIRGQG